jgi:hypothetical protein
MSTSNFSLCLWTVVGIMRQGLSTQHHVLDGGHGAKLMTIGEFEVSNNTAGALPDHLLGPDLINIVRDQWLGKVNKVTCFWDSKFKAKDINRIPLKLPVVVGAPDPRLCRKCGQLKCNCGLDALASHVESDPFIDKTNLSSAAATDDHTSGSADGLLNFFPADIYPYNIGSKIGLARMLAHFNIQHSDGGQVKILNTDVQIFERIIKVNPLFIVTTGQLIPYYILHFRCSGVDWPRWLMPNCGLLLPWVCGTRTSRPTSKCSGCTRLSSLPVCISG